MHQRLFSSVAQLLTLSLLTACGAAAQQPASDLFVNPRLEHVTIDESAAIPGALEVFVDAALADTLPPPTTAPERDARGRTRQEVLNRAGALVRYRVLSGPTRRPGGAVVAISAEIDRGAIRSVHAQMLQRADELPRYSIVVLIDSDEHRRQRIEPIHVEHEIRPDSEVSKRVRNALSQQNFKVVSAVGLEDLREFKLDRGRLAKESAASLCRSARGKGADIVLVGSAKADGPQPKIAFNRTFYDWFGRADVTAYWADTADEIGTIVSPVEGWHAADENRDAGSDKAIAKAAEEIAAGVVTLLRERGGRVPEVKITIKRVASFQQFQSVSAQIKGIAGVTASRPEFGSETLEDSVRTALSSGEIADGLGAWTDPEGRARIDVTNVSTNAIEARIVPR